MAERVRVERKNPMPREEETPSASGSGRRRGRPRKRHNFSSSVTPPPPPPPLTEISSSSSFFKVFFPDASSQKLRIPPAFSPHIDKRAVDGTVYLRGPSGHKWQVDLMQSEDDELFFESGWKDFVFDHSIQTGEILVFRYEGQRSFLVQLFDRSACEKDSAFSARPSKYTKGQNENGPPGLERQENMALVVVKKEEPVDEADFMAPRMLLPSKTPEQQSYKRWLSDNTNGRSCTEVTKPKRVPTIVSQRRPVTEQEISDTLKRAKSFTSDNPYVAIPMRNSYVYISFFLNLPTDFVKDHLPKSNAKFTMLDPTGRSWPISYVCYNGRHGALSGGWGKAAVANNLEIHDVVVFELVKKNQLTIHIYRVVEEITPFRRGYEVEREARLNH